MFKSAAFILICVVFCLAAGNPTSRVTGGRDAVRRQAPFAASIRNFGTNFHVGGGALINDRWVVTCASILIGRADNAFDVALGIIQLSQSSVSGSVSRRSAELVPHPGFVQTSMINDIGLVRLGGVGSISYSDFIAPIFFEATRWDDPVTAILAGWGGRTDIGPTGDNLQILQTETITNTACEAVHGSRITRDMICTSNPNGSGICTTAVGSPLVSGLHLLGIASSTDGCGSTRPNIYTRLSSYRTWIGSITGT